MSDPNVASAPATAASSSGKPTPEERGLASGRPTPAERGLAPNPGADSVGTGQAKASTVPQDARSPEWFANYLIDYLSGDERPSSKVILKAVLIVAKARGLHVLATTLLERPHSEYGNYLNLMFIVIQADGSRELAESVADIFARQNLLVVPGAHIDGRWEPRLQRPASTEGTGAAAVLTYQGRTLIQIAGEGFYISGAPPPGSWTPKGGSTSVLFIYRASNPKKMYRLDFDVLKQGALAGEKGWEHNQSGVAKILGLTISNHQPAGGWGRAAGWACRVYKWGGRALFAIGAAVDAATIYQALDRGRASVQAAGRLAGGVAGGATVGFAGGRIGARAGPWGAAAGVFVGGLFGGWFGAALGQAIADWGYCLLFVPLESEEWRILTDSQVEPAPIQ